MRNERGGSSSSSKGKKKSNSEKSRPPRRGLGVDQLERILHGKMASPYGTYPGDFNHEDMRGQKAYSSLSYSSTSLASYGFHSSKMDSKPTKIKQRSNSVEPSSQNSESGSFKLILASSGFYESLRGVNQLTINFDKFGLCFGSTVIESNKSDVRKVLDVLNTSNPKRYLGLPVIIVGNKMGGFPQFEGAVPVSDQLLEYENAFSRGKEIFVKSVLQPIPLYAMSCFCILNQFVETINSLKASGGLSFRSLAKFNVALLVKQDCKCVECARSARKGVEVEGPIWLTRFLNLSILLLGLGRGSETDDAELSDCTLLAITLATGVRIAHKTPIRKTLFDAHALHIEICSMRIFSCESSVGTSLQDNHYSVWRQTCTHFVSEFTPWVNWLFDRYNAAKHDEILYIIWALWYARNKLVHEGKRTLVHEVLTFVRVHCLECATTSSQVARKESWSVAITRNDERLVIRACICRVEGVTTSFETEARGVVHTLELVADLDFVRTIFEGDAWAIFGSFLNWVIGLLTFSLLRSLLMLMTVSRLKMLQVRSSFRRRRIKGGLIPRNHCCGFLGHPPVDYYPSQTSYGGYVPYQASMESRVVWVGSSWDQVPPSQQFSAQEMGASGAWDDLIQHDQSRGDFGVQFELMMSMMVSNTLNIPSFSPECGNQSGVMFSSPELEEDENDKGERPRQNR
ncbi:Elongation factor Ts isoform 1 [Hibiscus syriacus]|uniref:Elongation factor Ts isoform 1 n=1 Tax=Hibiscus syriacus TaxID=106335 RepID=A0A6A2X2N9_HIBSY|nr:Elongation factor Ts isoform 1 [Hibiscus syriacus]